MRQILQAPVILRRSAAFTIMVHNRDLVRSNLFFTSDYHPNSENGREKKGPVSNHHTENCNIALAHMLGAATVVPPNFK